MTSKPLTIESVKINAGIVVGQNFELQVQFKNRGRWAIAVDIFIKPEKCILQSVCNVGSILPSSEKVQVVPIKIAPQSSYSAYPLSVTLEVKRSGKEEVILVHPFDLTAALFATSNDQRCVALLMGAMGSGKTSFAKTLMSAFHGWSAIAEMPTTKFEEHIVTDSVTILDTWGHSKGRYVDDEFVYMLGGMLPKNWSKDVIVRMRNLEGNPEVSQQMRPTAVIFFIGMGDIDKEEQTDQLKTWLRILGRQRQDLNPVLVVSKVDQIDETLRKKLASDVENSDLKTKIRQLSALTGVPQMNIYPLCLHCPDSNSSPVQRNVLEVLLRIAS